ncbi:hypothetical protein [Synechococcus phage Ssp-JY38]|nr:hypothetical protein [Synechococcus phage Yong-L2-223]
MTKPIAVQQDWVLRLSHMQQSVLIAAVRAPDGIRKDHPVKVLMRWYRRCVLLSAFDGKPLLDPFTEGGGSFTGPFTASHFDDHLCVRGHTWADLVAAWEELDFGGRMNVFDQMRGVYLRHVDELPHHFQLHFMHAAQIVGYKHNVGWIRNWWLHFYHMIVNDAHLFPESEEQMDKRLGDFEAAWRAREEVTAK